MSTTTTTKKPTGVDLYARYALSGALCCSITHGALTPVDVVKTRKQLDPVVYNKGMIASFRQIIQAEGPAAIWTGVGPTFAGYFLQGAFKFGGYEFFKKQFVNSLGIEKATENRTAIYLASSALAEFFADIALCPLEATRIRLVSQPTFANGLLGGFTRLLKEEGVIRGFYSGFFPILLKQIPYTMAKFVVYELCVEEIANLIGKPKSEMSKSGQMGVDLTSGLIAGACAAIISQPADTLLSKINKQKGAEGASISSRLIALAKELGPRGLFLGLGPRIVMVGALTAGQFAIYSSIKAALNATGGTEIQKIKK
ncbi:hypothetical protein FDP41_011380 [Naegleria fowleri]|uniref:Mitochondrial phosphate carrier protein n=1 Tax=Naegleria fowleri TaxID=5763 RepID=A0A6A5C9Q8_NAEFO|nr:uncharacterized protein FDP41_011380 [Naegleria fowleri]KAF0982450.1 hypothetical protein FDP41_011380 [Naegleria fowleri]CAG4718270.1 unnamed protein product [Naegleria fowleri]